MRRLNRRLQFRGARYVARLFRRAACCRTVRKACGYSTAQAPSRGARVALRYGPHVRRPCAARCNRNTCNAICRAPMCDNAIAAMLATDKSRLSYRIKALARNHYARLQVVPVVAVGAPVPKNGINNFLVDFYNTYAVVIFDNEVSAL